MAEPVSVGAASTVTLGGGLLVAVLSAIGISAPALFWALVGATLGMTWAPPAARGRAAAVFVAVVFSSALLGTWAAEHFVDSPSARNGLAWAMGVGFHLLLAEAMKRLPQWVGWIADRFRGVR